MRILVWSLECFCSSLVLKLYWAIKCGYAFLCFFWVSLCKIGCLHELCQNQFVGLMPSVPNIHFAYSVNGPWPSNFFPYLWYMFNFGSRRYWRATAQEILLLCSRMFAWRASAGSASLSSGSCLHLLWIPLLQYMQASLQCAGSPLWYFLMKRFPTT